MNIFARCIQRLLRPVALATLLLAVANGPARSAEAGSTQSSSWQHQQVSTTYFGTTARFTCSGIEEAVKQLLLYFGARRDLRVTASCPDLERPVVTAVVHSDFYALAPADIGATDTVPGEWQAIRLSPRVPRFMDRNECELVDQFKELLSKHFSLRDLQYRTSCTPYDSTLEDYNVTAQVLKPVSVH
jgi:hypothetical protein